MAAPPWLHLQGGGTGGPGRRHLQYVVPPLRQRPHPRLGGEYLALEPGKRIRYTDRFDDPNLPGEMQVTITLTQVPCGTDLAIEQAGIPAVIPVEMCYLGWQESLMQLATLVEPEIPAE